MPVVIDDSMELIDDDGILTQLGQKTVISYLGFLSFMSNRMAKDVKFRQEIVKAYGDEPEIVVKKMRKDLRDALGPGHETEIKRKHKMWTLDYNATPSREARAKLVADNVKKANELKLKRPR